MQMIKGTLVNITKGDAEKETPHTPFDVTVHNHAFAPHYRDMGWEFEPLATRPFENGSSALIQFSAYIKAPERAERRFSIGMMLHHTEHLRNQQHTELLYLDENENLTKTTIINPLWSGLKPVRRNIDSGGVSANVSLAMQSQLFAMLDRNAADDNWIQSFDLKDRQQQAMYRWQQSVFPTKNTMGPYEMSNLMKNVLNVARLPWIALHFQEKGDSCKFVLSLQGGRSLTSEADADEADVSKWGWLTKADEARFEKVGTINSGYRLRISDMRLVMVMEWAMNAPILLHELAHYITFISPTPYRLNRGEHKLSFKQYEELFAGHGAVYMAVFARLLIDFHRIKASSLYESLDASGLNWFPIDNITTQGVTNGITKYCNKWKKDG